MSIEVKYDDALNNAGWKLLGLMQDLGVDIPPVLFNNLKPILKETIEQYLTEKLTK